MRPAGWIVFALALGLATWGSIRLAEKTVVPHLPPRADMLPEGVEVRIPDVEPARYAAADARELREFLFALHVGIFREEPVAAGRIERIAPGTLATSLGSDADMTRVRFQEGALEGRELWVKTEPLLEAMLSVDSAHDGGSVETEPHLRGSP